METENNQNNGLSFVGLHDELDIGFCIIEVRFADVAQPSDYRFVEVNAAFEKHTGIQGATGRWMRNLVPDLEQYWFDRYQDIAATGKPAHFEYVAKAMEQRHFDVYAYRIDNPDNPGKYYVAVLFSDISARKKEEARSAALLALSDAFNQLGDTASLTDTASRVLGETLGVQLVGYGIVDAISESLRVENDWTRDGGRSLKGTVHFRDYGSYIEDFKRGETVVVNDARTDPRTRDFAAALEARSARAFVNAPVFERGEFVALLYVSTVHPRNWTPGELTFIRDVALRTRTATARRQAERERRELAASLEGQVLARTRELDRSWQLSQELLVVALPDGTIEAINPMWTTVLGYTPDDLIGKPFVEFTHLVPLPPPERRLALAVLDRRLRERQGVRRRARPDAGAAPRKGLARGRRSHAPDARLGRRRGCLER
jgi:PAS domain S-box-containing protein